MSRDDKVILKFQGDNNQVTVNKNVYNLGENPKVRQAINGMLEPLEREGIDEIVAAIIQSDRRVT